MGLGGLRWPLGLQPRSHGGVLVYAVLKHRARLVLAPLVFGLSGGACSGPERSEEIAGREAGPEAKRDEPVVHNGADEPGALLIEARKVIVDLERRLALAPPGEGDSGLSEGEVVALKEFLSAHGARDALLSEDLALVTVVVGREAAERVLDRVRARLSPGWIAFLTDLPRDRDHRLRVAVAPGHSSVDALIFIAPRHDLCGLEAGALRQRVLAMGLPAGLALRYVSAEAITFGYEDPMAVEGAGLARIEGLASSLRRQKGWDNGRSPARFVAQGKVTLRWAARPDEPAPGPKGENEAKGE